MPFLTDLKLPEYAISLTIPTTYNEIMYERLSTLRTDLLTIHNSEEEQFLVEQIRSFFDAPFVETLSDGRHQIEMQKHFFISPWQLATSLHEMLHLAIQQQINQEKEHNLLSSRSDLEDFFINTHRRYGIEETHENMILRRTNKKQLEDAEYEDAMKTLAQQEEKELAALDEAMRAVPASYSPNPYELALADKHNEKSAEDLAIEALEQELEEEYAERQEALMNERDAQKDIEPSGSSRKEDTPSDGASTKSITSALAVDSDSENQLPAAQKRSPLVASNKSKYLTPIAGIKRLRVTALAELDKSNSPESSGKPLKSSRGSSSAGSFAEAVLSSRGSSPAGSFAEGIENSRNAQSSPSL